jgi:hypothetical protein
MAFSINLSLEIKSCDLVLDICLREADGRNYSISRCPYIVAELLCNQGLHSVFGWRSYRQANAAGRARRKWTAVEDLLSLVESIQVYINTL